MNKKIAMMGGKNSILPFKGLGIDIYPVDDLEEAAQQLQEMAEDYGVIFLTVRLIEQLESIIRQYEELTTPAIIPIPSSTGSLGIGMARIQQNVEKAVGMNILDS